MYVYIKTILEGDNVHSYRSLIRGKRKKIKSYEQSSRDNLPIWYIPMNINIGKIILTSSCLFPNISQYTTGEKSRYGILPEH